MEIVVNGRAQTAPEESTLLDLLRSLSIDPARVAIELNGEIVKKAEWGETRLSAGAQLEIVHFVGGGRR
ncbi:MAG: sulfur carrier protein ThiS [Bryobacterales bacterium]|nr:sulfur carrier protein ThiS [Bryobacterales bacterium]